MDAELQELLEEYQQKTAEMLRRIKLLKPPPEVLPEVPLSSYYLIESLLNSGGGGGGGGSTLIRAYPVDVPIRLLTTPNQIYEVPLVDVTAVEFSARNAEENVRWGYNANLTNYKVLTPRTYGRLPIKGNIWTGSLFFSSFTESNVEIEINAFSVQSGLSVVYS